MIPGRGVVQSTADLGGPTSEYSRLNTSYSQRGQACVRAVKKFRPMGDIPVVLQMSGICPAAVPHQLIQNMVLSNFNAQNETGAAVCPRTSQHSSMIMRSHRKLTGDFRTSQSSTSWN
jgi:hypothetical protein